MDWKLTKEQIAEVAAMFTELCEQITDKEISLNLSVRNNDEENGEVRFTYDAYAVFDGKLIYINMGKHRSLVDSPITNIEAKEVIALLKGNK